MRRARAAGGRAARVSIQYWARFSRDLQDGGEDVDLGALVGRVFADRFGGGFVDRLALEQWATDETD